MTKKLIVNISAFARMVCSQGHINPATPPDTPCPTCKSRGRKPSSTIRLMCRQGRIPGAIQPGTEWLIDVGVAQNHKIDWRGRGRPKE